MSTEQMQKGILICSVLSALLSAGAFYYAQKAASSADEAVSVALDAESAASSAYSAASDALNAAQESVSSARDAERAARDAESAVGRLDIQTSPPQNGALYNWR